MRTSSTDAGGVDLSIGCTALQHGEPVVTRNKLDVQGIPGLEVSTY